MKRYQVIGICLAIGFIAGYASAPSTDKKENKPTISKAEEKAAQEKARLEAMTPEERDAESKRKAFESTRSLYGHILVKTLKETAFDSDALKIDGPTNYKNGVCVKANGKNRFGAYVGWQEHCYLLEGDKWVYSGPNNG